MQLTEDRLWPKQQYHDSMLASKSIDILIYFTCHSGKCKIHQYSNSTVYDTYHTETKYINYYIIMIINRPKVPYKVCANNKLANAETVSLHQS